MDIRKFFAPKSGSATKGNLHSSLQDQKKVPATPENPRHSPRKKDKDPHPHQASTSDNSSSEKITRCSARRIISSDEESDSEDPVPSKVAKRLGKITPKSPSSSTTTRQKNKRSFRHLSSDDDSDVEITGTKQAGKPVKKAGTLSPVKKKPEPKKAKKKNEPPKKLNPISAADFFGSARVKSRPPTNTEEANKAKTSSEKKTGTSSRKETEHHGDDSFDALLVDLDSEDRVKETEGGDGDQKTQPVIDKKSKNNSKSSRVSASKASPKKSSKDSKIEEKDGTSVRRSPRKKEAERHKDNEFNSLLRDLDTGGERRVEEKEDSPIIIEEFEDSNSNGGESRKRKKSQSPDIVVSDEEDGSSEARREAKRPKEEAHSLATRHPVKSPVVEFVKKGQESTGLSEADRSVSFLRSPPTAKLSPKRKKTPLEFTSSPVRKSPRRSETVTLTTPTDGRKTLKEGKATEEKDRGTPSSADAGKGRKSHGGGPGYHSYLNRDGPQALGTKDIPEGAENCLRGKTFVITGVLESIERDDAQALVEKHGGKVTSSVSKKTSFVVVGRDAGRAKLDKIEKLKLKTLSEDDLFDMIRKSKPPTAKKTSPEKSSQTSPPEKKEAAASTSKTRTPTPPAPKEVKKAPEGPKSDARPARTTGEGEGGGLSWVDKHKPAGINQLIGQNGAKSPMHKLIHWLQNWGSWHLGEKKTKKGNAAPWKCEDGQIFKAALLSGPPGIGKTSTAILVCEHLGLKYELLNASDARNKKSLVEKEVTLSGTQRIENYAQKMGSDGEFMEKMDEGRSHHSVKHVLIMDEVDGMSGNQDRSGMAELMLLIKKSRVPVVCICNDRHSQKIRSLANHCFDLRFQRPRTEQIRGRILSIACKEGLKLNAQTADQLIEGANHDIRQVIHHLNLLSATNKHIGFDQARDAAKAAHKDVTINLFEAAREVLAGGGSGRRKSLNEKAELFFVDYSLIPLFVYENYLSVVPHGSKSMLDRLDTISRVADSICMGDRVERLIRSRQAWNLLPLQAMSSSVIPSELLGGYMQSQLQFPQFLGKMSTTNRRLRLANQLQQHSAVRLSGDVGSLVLDYIPYLRDKVTEPLARGGTEGVRAVVDTYEAYDLTREDVDTILELGQFPGCRDPMQTVEPKVKAAVTREFNKDKHILPYSSEQLSKGRKRKGDDGGGRGAEGVVDEAGNPLHTDDSDQLNQEEEDTTNGNAEAFKKKVPATKKAANTGTRGQATGGRGRGRKK